MKINILTLFLLVHFACFSQETWHPLGDDDFNRPACGAVHGAGRNPMIIKNDHAFFFNFETPDNGSTNYHFSIGKYNGSQWEHIDFPFFFSNTPKIDCAVDSNEVPYVLFNNTAGNNLPTVRKFENGSWVDVGTNISTLTSSFLNIKIGTDNLPQILFQEGNVIKLKKYDGSNWILISETTEFFPYTTISLELDNNDVPYVVTNYQNGSNYGFVKKFNGTAWEEVGITGFTYEGSSLVFDVSNTPYLIVGTSIKKFDGSAWVNSAVSLTATPAEHVYNLTKITFDQNNNLFAGFVGTGHYGDLQGYYIKKLVNGVWQLIYTDGWNSPRIFAASSNSLYYLYLNTTFYPQVYKTTNGQSTLLGSFSYDAASNHDFSICNGIPTIAYINNDKASVKMFIDNNWTNLGPLQISENSVGKVFIKSGTDGNIYLAYNNQLSSSVSDTKLTVKKLIPGGVWQAVGPVNFSLSAGSEFDFKLSHANEPYVLYQYGRVQKFDGNNWVFVGGSAYNGNVAARLSLDSNDIPYLAFLDSSNNYHIAVKRLNGSVWEYVDQAGLSLYTGIQNNPKIVIDASNNIYLGFTDSNGKIHIKKLNNNLWESVGPDFFSTGTTEKYEIAVDHNSILYLIYNESQDNFRAKAKVKKFNGTTWEFVGQPNFSPASMLEGKIDFWENNTPIVSYSTSCDDSRREIHARFFGELNALSISEPQFADGGKKWIATPNPITTTFSIQGNDGVKLVEIFDMTGKKVAVENANFNTIDISSLHSGIYLAKIKTDSEISTIKLIKK